jgi:hypothetical protein
MVNNILHFLSMISVGKRIQATRRCPATGMAPNTVTRNPPEAGSWAAVIHGPPMIATPGRRCGAG